MFPIFSSSLVGINAQLITVETDISFGMRVFSIVGLPDTSVKESRDRIRAAFSACGLSFPRGRITVNLAPANLKKPGAVFDLAIAVALLVAQGVLRTDTLEKTMILGELSLNGAVRPVRGVLPASVLCKNRNLNLIVPQDNFSEASLVDGIAITPASSLTELIDHVQERKAIVLPEKNNLGESPRYPICFSDIRGHESAKRGLEIAAAGGHNILLKGSPGTGKSMLAKAFPSILPPLTDEEAIEVTAIQSVVTEDVKTLSYTRPFRAPHHSASATALIGGGAWPKPGEVSLAHRGVLFLDELPEFSRYALEHLRQPLEDGEVMISRASGSYRFPSEFILAATMNPCPCGFADDPASLCECSPGAVARYKKKISGPLLDRFDLVVDVPNVSVKHLTERGEASSKVVERVSAARFTQMERQGKTNTELSSKDLESQALLSDDAAKLLLAAFEKKAISTRGFFRLQKVARTIADLAGSTQVEQEHLAEALQYRVID